MKTIVVNLREQKERLALTPEEKQEVEAFQMAEESAKDRIEIAGVHGTPYSRGNKARVQKGNSRWSDKNRGIYDKEPMKVFYLKGSSPKEKVVKSINIGDLVYIKDRETGMVFQAIAQKFGEKQLTVLTSGLKTRHFGYKRVLTEEQATSGLYKVME